MAESSAGHDRQHVDPAALMAAAVAAVLTITLSEGEWWWLDLIIGITLLLVLLAFYQPAASEHRSERWLKAGAFGTVAGLSVVLVVGYPIQQRLRERNTPACGGTPA